MWNAMLKLCPRDQAVAALDCSRKWFAPYHSCLERGIPYDIFVRMIRIRRPPRKNNTFEIRVGIIMALSQRNS
jgi:hypothetical protein